MTMGRGKGLGIALATSAVVCCLLFSLSGCAALPERREIESLLLLRTMGVDATAEGVAVTASSEVQSKGVGEGSEPPKVFGGKGGTVSGACLGLQRQGEARLFFGHVGQLLLGEEQARADLSQPLGYVERDVEMRLDTAVYVVKGGTAEELVSAAATPDAAATDRLEALEESGQRATTMPRTVKDVLEGLAQNAASFAPAVVAAGEGEIVPVGYAIFRGNRLAGWAEGEAARGVNLALGQVDADILEVGAVALRLVGAKTTLHPIFHGDTLVGLTLKCTVDANIAQAPDRLDLTHGDEMERLRATLAGTVERRLRAAVGVAQELDADFMGLGRGAGLSAPWHWADMEEQWGSAFSTLPVSVEVRAEILRGYDIKG